MANEVRAFKYILIDDPIVTSLELTYFITFVPFDQRATSPQLFPCPDNHHSVLCFYEIKLFTNPYKKKAYSICLSPSGICQRIIWFLASLFQCGISVLIRLLLKAQTVKNLYDVGDLG